MILAAAALLFALGVLVLVYTRPPTRSSVALRRRLDELEELADRTHTELKRLIKRYRSLEGHVYGSFNAPDDDEDEEVAPSGAPEPVRGQEPDSLALVPDETDFPEELFQAQLAARRNTRA